MCGQQRVMRPRQVFTLCWCPGGLVRAQEISVQFSSISTVFTHRKLNEEMDSNEALLRRVRELEQTAGQNGTMLSSSRRLTLWDL